MIFRDINGQGWWREGGFGKEMLSLIGGLLSVTVLEV